MSRVAQAPRPVVGRTPWSSAEALAGPPGLNPLDPVGEERVQGDSRGPAGPPHNFGDWAFTLPMAALLFATALSACGYRVSGHSNVLPKSVRTIAIPAFANNTAGYRLSDGLSGSLTREFISRTRYNVVADPNAADAVLTGSVDSIQAYPTIFDPVSGRAAGVQTIVNLKVTLTERASGKVLFTRTAMEVRERYEISVDQRAYFDESSTALERLSRDVARALVSAVLETF